MLKINDKTDLNQISLTGARALAILGLLSESPYSINEIKTCLINYNFLEPAQPVDVLRVDLNTLKEFGCEFSRPCKRNGNKYELLKSPFRLNLTKDDVKLLKRVYSGIKTGADISVLLEYDDLFKKLAENIEDEDTGEALLGISTLKHYNIAIIKRLVSICAAGDTVKLTYKKPTSDSETEKNIIAEKLAVSNKKVYLYGYDVEKNAPVMLHCKNITNIISKNPTDKSAPKQSVKVKFKLRLNELDILQDNEKILYSNEGEVFVEGNYFNDFIAAQRVLSFGSKCTVLEPVEIRNLIISKLRMMRERYETRSL